MRSTNKKNILFVTPELNSGGAERQMVNIAIRMKAIGANVEFLVYTDEDFYSHLLAENGIKIHWILLPGYIKRMLVIRRFVRKGNYDAVISFLEVANFLNNFAAAGFGKKWLTITGERSAQDKIFKGMRGRLFSWFMRYSDYIVCNSNRARSMWIDHYPQYAEKLKVIYNTINIPCPTSEYIPKYDGRLHVVVAATIYDLKNPVNLVRALAMMNSDERSKIHIDWYGRIPPVTTFDNQRAYSTMMEIIRDNGLENVITIHNPSKEIYNVMYAADVVALFSHIEGMPNTIAEGMMIGKPIIMTRVSDYDVLVNDDIRNGILCDSNSPESIKEALLSMAELSIDELLQIGDNSKTNAELLFAQSVGDRLWCKLLNL